jgi:hypothetical protein
MRDIISNLRKFDCVDEIIVFENEGEPREQLLNADAVIYEATNTYTYGRYLCAGAASNDIVFFQDDDLLVHNVDQLLEKFLENDQKKVVANLADDWSSRHWNLWQSPRRPFHIEVGFGSIAHKSMIGKIHSWPYEEYLLHRKADKIFTTINPWVDVRATSKEITRLKHEGKESGRDDNALWLRGDHKQLDNQVLPLALQWKKMLDEKSG